MVKDAEQLAIIEPLKISDAGSHSVHLPVLSKIAHQPNPILTAYKTARRSSSSVLFICGQLCLQHRSMQRVPNQYHLLVENICPRICSNYISPLLHSQGPLPKDMGPSYFI